MSKTEHNVYTFAITILAIIGIVVGMLTFTATARHNGYIAAMQVLEEEYLVLGCDTGGHVRCVDLEAYLQAMEMRRIETKAKPRVVKKPGQIDSQGGGPTPL